MDWGISLIVAKGVAWRDGDVEEGGGVGCGCVGGCCWWWWIWRRMKLLVVVLYDYVIMVWYLFLY